MKFDWSLKLMDPKIPLPIRRLIVNIIKMTILPRTNVIQQWRPTPFIHEQNSNGNITLYLREPKLLSVKIQSNHLPTYVNFNIPLNRRIESLPVVHGSTNMARFVDVLTKVECTHRATNEFITFDNVIYKYSIPSESCEQTLVKTINNVQVTVQAKGAMKILRFRMDKSVLVEVIPEKSSAVPKVKVS